MPATLEKTFELVRSEFFPHWDRARLWRCRQMVARQHPHDDALCVPPQRTIYVARKVLRWNRPQKLGVIIHEVCHALRPRSGHEEPWQDRMDRAAERAEAMGETALAQWLLREAQRYKTPPDRLGRRSTYHEIQDFVKESGTIPSFAVMVEEFSRSRSMTPPDFLKHYPRARKVYESAVPAEQPQRGRTGKPKLKKPMRSAKRWRLYVLRCKDHTLYCGTTNNLPARIEAHNRAKGARYTRGRGPVVLIKSWPAASISAALKAERAFKAMTRADKEKKISSRSRRDAISLLLRSR